MSVIELFLTFLLVCNISRKEDLLWDHSFSEELFRFSLCPLWFPWNIWGQKLSRKTGFTTKNNRSQFGISVVHIRWTNFVPMFFFFNFCGVYDKLYMNLSLLWFKMYLHSSLTIVLQITQHNFSLIHTHIYKWFEGFFYYKKFFFLIWRIFSRSIGKNETLVVNVHMTTLETSICH